METSCMIFKQRWNAISKDEKETWKKEAMFLIETAKVNDAGHIKEAVARVVVEVAKREFPQNWENFLPQLGELQTRGHVQLELTLLVFLRLGEDVILTLDPHLHAQRRRNIEQALSERMPELFTLFINTLQEHVGTWRKNREAMSLRIAEATLFTLSVYLTHAAIEHIFASNAVLLQILCQLLDMEELRMAAADCLLVLVERRRDRVEYRKPMLILFSDDAMNLFVEVARKACLAGAEEEGYNFLKKICDVIVGLGTCQLADIWGHDRGITERPDTFAKYLKLIIDMVNHPSQVICHKACSVCTTFFKHERISADETFIESIPFFIPAFSEKLPKFGGLDDDNHPCCKFSVIDHDSTNEFMEFYAKLRWSLTSNLKECTSLFPVHAFEHACRKVMEAIQKPVDLQDCVLWEALSTLLDAILSRFWRTKQFEEAIEVMVEREKNINVVAVANDILLSLIQFQPSVPQIVSNVLLCIQAFFPFFKKSQVHLTATLEKIMLTFNKFPLEDSNKDVIAVRRQATCSFINLCKQDSDHLLPFFESFHQFVSKLEQDGVVIVEETNTLTEGLLVLNNGMATEKRHQYLSLQVSKLDEIINAADFKLSLESTENFVKYIGLSESPWDKADCAGHRRGLLKFINLFLAIIRRSQLTEAEKVAISPNQGFFGNSTGFSWLQKSIDYLPQITQIVKHTGMLWRPEIQSVIHKDYAEAFKLHDNDRVFLLGQHVAKEKKDAQSCSSSVVTKASTFLYMLHNQSYTLLGNIGSFFQDHFYKYGGLANLIVNDIMQTWVYIPKYRFITVFKFFLKPFLSHCPPSCYSIAAEQVMSVALQSMLQFLSKEWSEFHQKTTQSGTFRSSEDQDETPNDQVIEERLIYSLSREYIETLVSLFFAKNKDKETGANDEDSSQPEPGDLGKFLLQCEATNSHFIFTMFTALTWPDTVSTNKVARVLPHITNFISKESSSGSKMDAAIINQLFLCILKGLQIHGAELSAQGSLLTAALHLYLNLRVAYPSIVQVMLMVPSCRKEQLMKFDLDVFEAECKLSEKKKREYFRKFLADAFGKNVSEIHNADIKIKDLQPLAPRKKAKPEHEDNIDSICNLFGEDS
ncbi:exportin-5-like isoform X2 [Rhopilema esculentum]|uniref:exportin-5-like isoform X2 n=1 Tax=Rhopilema esculentum TaxID=499914 RepID=UPI0031DDCD79